MNMLRSALSFLFVPESILSFLFLIAFFAILGYGIWQFRLCEKALNEFKATAKQRFAAERGHVNAATFIAHFDELQKIREIRLDGLPNIFIMVGILGTFLGLGIAIHGAANLLNADKVDLAQLNAVLSVIAFKFQTSVWGTLFSLVFQKFVAEPYSVKRQIELCETRQSISGEEVNTDAVLAGQLETLKSIYDDQSDTKSRITTKLESLEESQKRFVEAGETIGKAFQASTVEQMASNAKHMQRFEALTERMAKENSELNKTLTEATQAYTDHSFQAFQARLTEELGEQNAQFREMIAQQNELNESFSNAQIERLAENEETSRQYLQEMFEKQNELHQALIGEAANTVQTGGKSLLSQMSESLTNQQSALEGLLDQQNQLNAELVAQQKAMLGDTAEAYKAGAKSFVEQVTDALGEQKASMESLLAEQTRMNTELAAQQKAMLGDTADAYKAGAKSFVEQVTDALCSQKASMESLLAEQTRMNTELANQQKAMLGDTAEAYKAGAKSFVEQVTESLAHQQNAMQELLDQQNHLTEEFFGSSKASFANETKNFIEHVTQSLSDQQSTMQDLFAEQTRLNTELAEQQKVMLGDTAKTYKAGAKSFIEQVTDALANQQSAVQSLLTQQNKLTEEFFGSAKVHFGNETKSVVENITDALTEQRIHIQTLIEQQNKLNADLAAQQRALFGDAAESMEKSSQSFVSNITMQLAAQRGFMQELLQKQNEITAELNKAQKEFWGETTGAYAKESRGFIQTMTEQVDLQKTFMQHIIEQQNDIAKKINEQLRTSMQELVANQSEMAAELNAQREALWAKEKDERSLQTREFLENLESELGAQKKSMQGLVAEHARLSKVLLGDLENTTKENLIAANKGFVQHMEEYKAFSEKIAAEQKRVQDALETKLTTFAKNMSEATAANNANIAEISKAMGVLHHAIENNSRVLKDIIENFYATQTNLDTVRRKEIKGLADAFTSMFEHESTAPASWRQGQDNAKRAAKESAVAEASPKTKGKAKK